MTPIHPASASTAAGPARTWSGPRVVHTAVARPHATDVAVDASTVEWLPRHRPDRRI